MDNTNFFINPQTGLLRAGWRALAFMFVLTLPQWLMSALFKSASSETGSVFEVGVGMILVYVILVGWVLLLSWAGLRFLDRLRFGAIGLSLHSHWRREVALGLGISFAMILVIVGLQFVAGGTRVRLNPFWFAAGDVDWAAFGVVTREVALASVLLMLAAAFEELVYRGYAFQTLLRGVSPIVPIVLLSVFFALGHWNNPSRTLFSTINTVLAGVWLAVAYLKTRSLWFPTALHFGWNYAMGAIFGLPVSGLLIPRHPILISTTDSTLWLTGGNYGPEGGAVATFVVSLAIFLIWKTRWLTISPEMQSAWSEPAAQPEPPIQLNLQKGEN